MAAIHTLDDGAYKRLEREIQQVTRGKDTLEAAAKAYSTFMYGELKDSIVLTRLFATVPFEQLPPKRAEFVTNLAASNGVADKLDKDTLVLSLLGTCGQEPEWAQPSTSKGHLGIPLASSSFIEAIPMMSRLLHQLGAGVDWIDRKDTSIVARALGMLGGVFYVQDASTELDAQGRKIIAGQQFVEAYHVKSVFGFGGGYSGTQIFIVGISFLRDSIDKATAERFLSHVNRIKASTMDVVSSGALFDPS
ncbi:MAG: hypothetical protein HY898_23545 [Deltaproteobacteria bacterium]|nr:hypothetical protein [Deltaproteobacteria bacterium]